MKPLAGITVLEFSTMITASFAAMMMAEQGARVVKVEPIEAGDPMRYVGTAKGGMAALFANCNRGKRSLRVNLKAEAGQALVRELAGAADIVIHNYRPGVMDRLGLGSERLRAENPRLIYMAISGFGKAGPQSGAPAYDPIIQASAGITAAQGRGEPAFVRSLICDKITAYTACQAVTAALYVRERTGEGQHIDLSMLDAGLFFIFPDAFQNHTLLDEDIDQAPLLADLIYELTQTKDGAIAISAGTDEQRMRSLEAVGLQHLFADPRFSSMESLMQNYEAFTAEVKRAYLQLSTEEALARLSAADVPCAKCLSHEETLAQEQLAANNSLEVMQHPLMGRMRVIKSPARFAGERLAPSRPAPAHGEHSRELLAEFALPEARIAALLQSNTIA